MAKNLILVLNSGSSSIKFQLFTLPDLQVIAKGLVADIGGKESALLSINTQQGQHQETLQQNSHAYGLELLVQSLKNLKLISQVDDLLAIGHRVVQGGEIFKQDEVITEAKLEILRKLSNLAPLHNPNNIRGISLCQQHFPDVPQVAVFDTAYHQSLPEYAYRYAIPLSIANAHNIRRFGFHGISHYYVATQAARHLQKPLQSLNIISLHLGAGASATAIQKGKSIDTSMGLTPLEGLMMSSRSGNLDPGIIFHLNRETGMDNAQIEEIINNQSGLVGICGTADMREVQHLMQHGDAAATLAFEMYCYRIKKQIGAYFAALGAVDCIVFTGGIGENSALLREKVCHNLSSLGIGIDRGKNNAAGKEVFEIQQQTALIKIMVVKTNEELEIARQTKDCLSALGAT